MNDNSKNTRSDWYSAGVPEAAGNEEQYRSSDEIIKNDFIFSDNNYDSSLNEEANEVYSKPRRGATRITAFICVIALIISAVYVGFIKPRSRQAISLGNMPEKTSPAEKENTPAPTPGKGEDYKSFFEKIYPVSDNKSAEISMPKISASKDASIDLAPEPEEEQLSLQELYVKCSPYTVAIRSKTGGQGSSWGTGIIMSEDGYIITNAHVIEGASEAEVILNDDRTFKAQLVGSDSISDIAVIKISAKGLAHAVFCTDHVVEGDAVVAIGNPLGENLRGTMTNGIISAISRDMSHKGHTMTLLQTNVAINEGNSGGPLINMHGQVVGITNMKLMSVSSRTIEGIGFAIPVSTVKQVVESILDNGKVLGRPMIGVTVGPIPAEIAEHYKLPKGLYITKVSPGSDAEKQGVKPGDILISVNGNEVTETRDVLKEIKDKKVGDILSFEIFRDGKNIKIDVKLVESSDIY